MGTDASQHPYVVCAAAGIVAGVYGLYVLVVHVLIVEEPNFVGLITGVLLTGGGFGLFSLARNLISGGTIRMTGTGRAGGRRPGSPWWPALRLSRYPCNPF